MPLPVRGIVAKADLFGMVAGRTSSELRPKRPNADKVWLDEWWILNYHHSTEKETMGTIVLTGCRVCRGM
ncbi:hypothetical protein F2P79_011182 [Pimephales promelas]|nr:hypothetical protein F2P79_011182 [Pimephales promelas]